MVYHLQANEITEKATKNGFSLYCEIFKRTWVYLLTLLVTFSTTLIVFPAVTALITPTSKGIIFFIGVNSFPIGYFNWNRNNSYNLILYYQCEIRRKRMGRHIFCSCVLFFSLPVVSFSCICLFYEHFLQRERQIKQA